MLKLKESRLVLPGEIVVERQPENPVAENQRLRRRGRDRSARQQRGNLTIVDLAVQNFIGQILEGHGRRSQFSERVLTKEALIQVLLRCAEAERVSQPGRRLPRPVHAKRLIETVQLRIPDPPLVRGRY